jgi:dephospho-CoA kinase
VDDLSVSATRGRPLIVGLTGGIGSGKSAAASCFEQLGIPVIDADMTAREVVRPGSTALQQIAAHFGAQALLPTGELDRTALRQRVFSEPGERLWLEELLHPLIRERLLAGMAQAAARPGVPYVILSSPLLLETGQDALVDRVLLIDVDAALQRERVLRRDGSPAATVDAMMAAQWTRERRRAGADDVILNEGSLADLQTAVRKLDARYRQRPPCNSKEESP